MTDIKPCPFCGNEKFVVWQKKRGGRWAKVRKNNYQVWCTLCKARGPLAKDTEELAIEKWNKAHDIRNTSAIS